MQQDFIVGLIKRGNDMQKSKRDFLKTTATVGAFLVSAAITMPTRHVLAVEKIRTEDWKPSSDTSSFPLNYQQILKHLMAANDVAKEAAEFGHHPFGAVLVAPNGEKVLMKQGNLNSIMHAETELSRRAFAQYNPDYLWGCTLVTTFEPCVMCAGNIYWANIGNLVYGVEETTLKKLTGTSKDNPTMNLPCRTVFEAGQKPILVAGPFPELEDELVAPHRAFWK